MQKYPLFFALVLIVLFTGFSSKQWNAEATPVTITPPPMESMGQGARLPTKEELHQEQLDDLQRVNAAIKQLKTSNVQQRIIATETLNAYQLPEAQRQLNSILLYDNNPEVRQTAAMGLAYFKKFSWRTINALIKALDDNDKATRKESFDTLTVFTMRPTTDRSKSSQILKKLRKKNRSRKLYNDVRTNLTAFIKDQTP